MTTNRQQSDNQKGHQGFASMPREQVKEIASKGGQASHGGTESSNMKQSDDQKGHQGFASMPKEQVKEIASKGGQASHGGRAESSSQSSSDRSHSTSSSRRDEDDENE